MKNKDTKYLLIILIIVVIAVGVIIAMSNNNNPSTGPTYTGQPTEFVQTHQNIYEAKRCKVDKDCALSECSGCFSKEFLDKAEPELPCGQFQGYACICDQGQCLEVER